MCLKDNHRPIPMIFDKKKCVVNIKIHVFHKIQKVFLFDMHWIIEYLTKLSLKQVLFFNSLEQRGVLVIDVAENKDEPRHD